MLGLLINQAINYEEIEFGEEKLYRILKDNTEKSITDLLICLVKELMIYTRSEKFDDDIAVIAIDVM